MSIGKGNYRLVPIDLLGAIAHALGVYGYAVNTLAEVRKIIAPDGYTHHSMSNNPWEVDERLKQLYKCTPLYAAPPKSQAAEPRAEPVALAQVILNTEDQLNATVRWLLNPLPAGSLLYECPAPDSRDGEIERLSAALSKYGRHGTIEKECAHMKHSDWACDCGFDAAMKGAKE